MHNTLHNHGFWLGNFEDLIRLTQVIMENVDMAHAIDLQKQMIALLSEMDDTSPLPPKEGRILVALDVLVSEISYDDAAESAESTSDGTATVEEAREWLDKAIKLLPGCVALFGGYGTDLSYLG
jgi:hypothetical protein